MRRVGELFDAVHALDNLRRAASRAARGKRYRPEVLRFNFRLEEELLRLKYELASGSWRPGPHRHFQIHDPKTRWISAAPYRDRVVHHALCGVIEPHLDRRLLHDCWANRTGKGTHRAVLRYQKFAGRFRYALKADIRRYFPSVDHALLKRRFRRVFKDRPLLSLMDVIVDQAIVPEPHLAWFPGDDLLTPLARPKGLPIGNLTSQLWANLYLSDFDHWLKHELRASAYLRFVDDFVLLSDSRRELASWRERVRQKLQEARLELHPDKCVIRRTSEGLPFLGYVVWPRRIRVRGETVRRFRRRFKARRRDAPEIDVERSLHAWRGHVRLAGSRRTVARFRCDLSRLG